MKERIKANIGVSEEHKQFIANDMQLVLVNEVVIYIKTRNYHWERRGRQLYGDSQAVSENV